MRSAIRCLAVVVAVLVCARPVAAQCDPPGVTVSVSTTGTYTKVCTFDAARQRWDILVTINGPVSGNSTVTITGGTNIMLGRVSVQNNSAVDSRVYIRGLTSAGRIGGVGSFDKGSSAVNKVLLLQCYTQGDIGYDRLGAAAIRADSIQGVDCLGSVLGNLESVAGGRSMLNVYIAGDLLGGISLGPTSSLDFIDVGGHIGSAAGGVGGEPVMISVPGGHIGRLLAGSINADITLWSFGVVHYFETRNGDFRGSLSARFLDVFGGTPGATLFKVNGNLSASLTLSDDIRVPFLVTGSFLPTRTVGGIQVPNIINSDRGIYDTLDVYPPGNMTIQGNFGGSLLFGTPNHPTLGSVNRDLIVGGEMSGMMSIAGDINANMSFGGVDPDGSVIIGGSHRAGRVMTFNGPLEGLVRIGDNLAGTIALPADGLAGQVVVNADLSGGTWTGGVTIGGFGALSPMPFFLADSDDFGGGSVGVPPFRLHGLDCTPRHNTVGAAGEIAASALVNGANAAVVINSYGPVAPMGGLSLMQSIDIERLEGMAWVDASSSFDAVLLPSGEGESRSIGLIGSGGTAPPAGQYRVRPVALGSMQVSGTPSVEWPVPDGYRFRITADCNNNGIGDAQEIAGNAALDGNSNGVIDSCEGGSTCACDWDNDGNVNVPDIFAFLTSWFAGDGDFDGMNGTTVPDIFAFLSCWFDPPAGC